MLVDGAHSVGALQELKVPDLGCAYFVSTLHKWLCTPKVGLVGHHHGHGSVGLGCS